MNPRTLLLTATILGALAIPLGAYGAHGLQQASQKWDVEDAVRLRRLDIWETGVRYQMYHALAILGVAVLAGQRNSRAFTFAGGAFLLGTTIFSGSMYLITLTGITRFGAIAPIGALLLVVGWVILAVAAWKAKE